MRMEVSVRFQKGIAKASDGEVPTICHNTASRLVDYTVAELADLLSEVQCEHMLQTYERGCELPSMIRLERNILNELYTRRSGRQSYYADRREHERILREEASIEDTY